MRSPLLGFGLFFLLLFLLLPEKFTGPDYPVYPAYILSVVQDGDLNLINNLHPPDPTLPCSQTYQDVAATRTYNTPDFHNHGAVLFWIPFYYYGEAMKTLVAKILPGERDPELGTRIAVSAIAFSTAVMAFLAALACYLLAAHFSPPAPAFWATMAVFWGSPAFLYTLFEPGNANIPALFLGSLFILATAHALTSQRRWPPFCLGLLFAICIVVKLDLWFLAIFIGLSFLLFWWRGQTTLAALGWFLLGLTVASPLKAINDLLKYGGWHTGEAGLLNFRNSYHLEQLFSPYQGYFSTSPLLLLCLLALPLLAWQLYRRGGNTPAASPLPGLAPLLLIMTAWLVAKLTAIGFRFAWGGGTFGARQLLSELPFFVLLLAFLLHQAWTSSQTWWRPLTATAILLLIGLNWLHAGEYLGGATVDYYLQPNSWAHKFSYLFGLIPELLRALLALPVKLLCLPLLALFLWLAHFLLTRPLGINTILTPWTNQAPTSTHPPPRPGFGTGLTAFTLLLVAGYGLITLLNLRYNQANVVAMGNSGCFDKTKLLTDGNFEAEENAASLKEMTYYFWKKGDKEQAIRLQILQQHLYPDQK